MMPNKGLSEAFLDPKKPQNRSEVGAQEGRLPSFFGNFIATLIQEAFREEKSSPFWGLWHLLKW